jgi:ADP-ribose pyrophosphatase YjhB (NUDIX family)
MKTVLMTLAFCIEENRILLGFKEKGFGGGRWNGFGGKVKEDESIEDALKRELLEESGLEAITFTKKAIHEFVSQRNKEEVLEVHTFWISKWQGEPQVTEEMRPQWFTFEDIPYGTMWPDDKLWLPQFLKGKTLKTRFVFGENDHVLEYDVQEVVDL